MSNQGRFSPTDYWQESTIAPGYFTSPEVDYPRGSGCDGCAFHFDDPHDMCASHDCSNVIYVTKEEAVLRRLTYTGDKYPYG